MLHPSWQVEGAKKSIRITTGGLWARCTVGGISNVTIRPAYSTWLQYNRRLREVVAAAGADDDREDEQVQAVDEIVGEQELDEPAAPVHLELTPPPRLVVSHGLSKVPLEHRGVSPLGVLERGRSDVLRQRVQPVRHGVVRIGRVRPGGGEDVARAPAEEEGVNLLEDGVHELAGRLVEVGDQPAAAVEAAAAVLIRRTQALVDASTERKVVTVSFISPPFR